MQWYQDKGGHACWQVPATTIRCDHLLPKHADCAGCTTAAARSLKRCGLSWRTAPAAGGRQAQRSRSSASRFPQACSPVCLRKPPCLVSRLQWIHSTSHTEIGSNHAAWRVRCPTLPAKTHGDHSHAGAFRDVLKGPGCLTAAIQHQGSPQAYQQGALPPYLPSHLYNPSAIMDGAVPNVPTPTMCLLPAFGSLEAGSQSYCLLQMGLRLTLHAVDHQ